MVFLFWSLFKKNSVCSLLLDTQQHIVRKIHMKDMKITLTMSCTYYYLNKTSLSSLYATNNYANKLTTQIFSCRGIIGPIRATREKYQPSPQKYVTSEPNHCPLKKEYRITKLSSDFISNITHDATSPCLVGRAIKNNILEYVGNNSVSSFVDTAVRGHSSRRVQPPFIVSGNC